MINIENLKKVYDNGYEALKSVDLEIKTGDLICLLGPSGCGKTTMLNTIAGLLDPTAGDIKFNGESVINKHPKDRNIGVVFQNYALYPHMSVLENIMFPLTVGKNKMSKKEAEAIAREYMKITQIEALANKKPGEMSGGQQQRVAITRALVQKPEVLLLDEPLSNLDARLRLNIREEIRRLVKQIGITTIFVTHDQEEALSISDKIALMNGGVVQQYDDPHMLYLEPANLFVATFMGNPVINTYEMTYQNGMLVGENLKLSIDQFKKDRFKEELIENKKYTIGIRPEYFMLDDQGDIEVEVELVELIGRDAIVDFTLEGKPSKAIADIEKRIKVGDKLKLSIKYEAIYLFDEEGARVY